jgi:hypothetical protein
VIGLRQLSAFLYDPIEMATPVLPAVATTVKIVTEESGSIIRPLLITIFMGSIAMALAFAVNFNEVVRNWNKYRCQPQYMATARLFGKNAAENFAYCAESVFKNQVPGTMAPLYKIMAQGTGVMSTILEAANSLRMVVSTLKGGLNNIVQDFTSRITQFFFAVRVQAQHLRTLMFRVYGTLIATFFMVFSGITAAQNFSDSTIGKFISFFACFPPSTLIDLADGRRIPIGNVKIGDVMAGNNVCTATFRFYVDGTHMVRLGDVTVSRTHYIIHNGKWIMAGDHPDAIPCRPWAGGTVEPLICLNTNTHQMIIGGYTFRDYDETEEADAETEVQIEKAVNGGEVAAAARTWNTYGPICRSDVRIRLADGSTVAAADLKLGDRVEGGGQVVGLVQKQTAETTSLGLSPSTLIYRDGSWQRAGRLTQTITCAPTNYVGAFIYPHSYMVTDSDMAIRDYAELCHPDAEAAYSAALALVGGE